MRSLVAALLLALAGPAYAQDSARKIDELVSTYAAAGKFNGTVLVTAHGSVIFEKGYGYRDAEAKSRNDANTIFQLASVSKQFTAVTILKLVELQQLSLSDKLAKFYPDFPEADSITIEQLLTHTSGIHDFASDNVSMTSATEATLIARFRDKPFDFPPGKGWRYSNSGYSLLAFIIQKAGGMTYEAAVRKYIFEPLEMTHSGFDFAHLTDPNRATGYSLLNDTAAVRSYIADSSVTIGAGSIYSTVGDLYKWHRGLQEHRIVSRELMERAYTPKSVNYGYGVMVDSMFGKRVIAHSGDIGGFTTYLARVTEDDVCIALLDNTEHVNMQTIARKILAILYHRPYRLTVFLAANKEVPVHDDILKRYVGRYKDQFSSRLATVALENGRLVFRFVGGMPFTLLPKAENRFFVAPNMASFEIEFTRDDAGDVSQLLFDDVGNIGTLIRQRP
jgi:CubicO group peptidase (beta-lactamase class C family)